MGKFIAFLYGMASYLIFFVAILYAIGFVMGLVVPKSIDTGTGSSAIQSIPVQSESTLSRLSVGGTV